MEFLQFCTMFGDPNNPDIQGISTMPIPCNYWYKTLMNTDGIVACVVMPLVIQEASDGV